MADTPYRILFLCTGNSARSIMAEALMGDLGAPRFEAFSAGSFPAGKVNPFAEAQLKSTGQWRETFRSKSWDEFAGDTAPVMDLIITVCDNAAGEACPVWPGRPTSAHWGFSDPAAFEGPDEAKAAEFNRIYGQIRTKIELFLALPLSTMTPEDIAAELRRLGELDPETL